MMLIMVTSPIESFFMRSLDLLAASKSDWQLIGCPIAFTTGSLHARGQSRAREWWSAAEHFDRRFPASLRRDLVSLRAATKTPRRRLRCRAGNRLPLLRYDVGRITIVAIPRGSIVAIPRRADPHPARADGASEMRKGCSAFARRYRDPLWPRNCRPDHRSSQSATEGHGMAASNAPSGSFGRRRNQPGQENGEETQCNSNGHREAPTNRAASTSGLGL